MTNKELIEKATITTAALANAGKLNPKQADRFIDFVIDETSMRNMVRVERFRNEQMLIEKIGVANRVAVPKAEAVDPALRRGVQTSKITLQPSEIMVPFEIGDIFKEHNIEGDNIEERIIQLMARRLANNLEELYWEGQVNGPAVLEGDILEGGSTTLFVKDTYLALSEGWLALAEGGNVVDAQNAPISQAIFAQGKRAMPNKFLKNQGLLKWFLSFDHEQAYREGLSNRGTGLGDAAVNGADAVRPFGIPMMPVSLLPSDPSFSEDIIMNTDGTTASQLSHAPVTDVTVINQALGKTPEAAFILATDYSQDLAAGTVTRLGGAIGSGSTVKVTYKTAGRMLLTNPMNLILAIGRDIRIERARNIYRGANEFAITIKTQAQIEELTAVTLIKNIAVPS